jgi:glycosyltransferase involved in cell wall biosynthesis
VRIAHIGHGRIEIPPQNSGAVEAIISDYQFWCEKLGHEFLVVNDLSPAHAMLEAEAFSPDAVHLHDESKIDAFAVLSAPVKIVTTHDPTFFEKPNAFKARFIKGDFMIGSLSEEQMIRFLNWGIPNSRLILTPNGARADLIAFKENPLWPDKIICLGMIGNRKRQNLLLGLPFVDCIGPVSTYDPVVTGDVTFDEWQKWEVYRKLTDYAALVLLSKSEAAPLVVMEAMMAGLDVVVSEAASANLDRSQPFVHVLDERTITNPMLLEVALNKVLSRPKDRAAVRAYAEQYFDWEVLVKRYLSSLWPIYRASSPFVQPTPF